MGMNPDVKAQWVAALREPDRKQAKHKLHTDKGQCCLGVLCEIAVRNGVIPEPEMHHGHNTETGAPEDYYAYGADADTHLLPPEVMRWANIRSHNPYVDLPDPKDAYSTRTTLSRLNDSGRSFAEIADLIDASL